MKRYCSRWLRLRKRNEYINDTVFLNNNINFIDYKNTELLKRFINKQGEIIQSIFNKLTTKYQKKVSKAIKRAREMALIPYIIIEQKDNSNFQKRNF